MDPDEGTFSENTKNVFVYHSSAIKENSNAYKQLYKPTNTYYAYAQLYQRLFGYAKIYYKDGKIVTDMSKLGDDGTSYYYSSKLSALKLKFDEHQRVIEISENKYFDLNTGTVTFQEETTCNNEDFVVDLFFYNCVPKIFFADDQS